MEGKFSTALVAVAIFGFAACGATMDGGTGGRGGADHVTGGGGSGGSLPSGGAGSGGMVGTGGGTTEGSGGASGGGGTVPGSGGTSGGEPTAEQACAALSKALCAKSDACTPFATGLLLGSRTVCEQRLALDCSSKFGAPGTAATPARSMACAESLAAVSCAAFAQGDFGPACAPQPGSLPLGGACGDDWQCASTFCARATDAVCGVCAAATQAGSPCVRGACSTGTVCPAGKNSCVIPEPGQVGAVCTIHEQCDIGNGVACNAVTARCIRVTLASATGMCGLAGATYAACPASGTCSGPVGGTCAVVAADGAACSTAAAGPGCLPPARCVAGRCTLSNPGSCAP
jgi:hypothetical protein